MKVLFSLSFLFLSLCSYSQILDPYVDWLDLNDFFMEEEVANRKIQSIRLKLSNKKDQRSIQSKGESITYQFDRNGRLLSAMKSTATSLGFDTSIIQYNYDTKGRLILKKEEYGPFSFEYHYNYLSDTSYMSYKIANGASKGDTLYKRKHILEDSNGRHTESIHNGSGKAFIQYQSTYNSESLKTLDKTIYLFNRNEQKVKYIHENNRIVGKHFQKAFGQKQDKLVKYRYKNDYIEFVEFYREGAMYEKMAFTEENELLKDIIIRNYVEKEVRLYRIEYSFY